MIVLRSFMHFTSGYSITCFLHFFNAHIFVFWDSMILRIICVLFTWIPLAWWLRLPFMLYVYLVEFKRLLSFFLLLLFMGFWCYQLLLHFCFLVVPCPASSLFFFLMFCFARVSVIIDMFPDLWNVHYDEKCFLGKMFYLENFFCGPFSRVGLVIYGIRIVSWC